MNRTEMGNGSSRQLEYLRNNGTKNSHYCTELHGTIMPMQCYTCPGGAMLFLTDVDHVGFEKANETRQNNLQSATVSLQVVIGLCRRKETAALKIKAAVSNGHENMSALRRLFFFCRRPAEYYSIFNSMFPVKFSHSMPI